MLHGLHLSCYSADRAGDTRYQVNAKRKELKESGRKYARKRTINWSRGITTDLHSSRPSDRGPDSNQVTLGCGLFMFFFRRTPVIAPVQALNEKL